MAEAGNVTVGFNVGPQVCPTCGTCPTCGGHPQPMVSPYAVPPGQPYTPPAPYYPGTTWGTPNTATPLPLTPNFTINCSGATMEDLREAFGSIIWTSKAA